MGHYVIEHRASGSIPVAMSLPAEATLTNFPGYFDPLLASRPSQHPPLLALTLPLGPAVQPLCIVAGSSSKERETHQVLMYPSVVVKNYDLPSRRRWTRCRAGCV
ncbi:hypothetical protein D9613_002426 [Agrocybe pediades]|uniref:Uncharacterized protein n=1 Tax=Agrocybe pediades TaxID=84607 RepID=A0A8H4R7M6_9AGAR|nr:hypothetical protein D9613_002426 [Agrocybe pediades]